MKKILLIFLPALISLSLIAQEDVVINKPTMQQMIDRLWFNFPRNNCIEVPDHVSHEGTDEPCAALALRHFRNVISHCTISDGIKNAIKTEFKIIKLIPVGRVAGFILDVADLT